jgi:hypothetical protein
MGAKAPDVITLIRTNLGGRDARGLAEDYLDDVGWPLADRRGKPRDKSGPRKSPVVMLRRRRKIETGLRLPNDPSRN